jgi:hypothetical protein
VFEIETGVSGVIETSGNAGIENPPPLTVLKVKRRKTYGKAVGNAGKAAATGAGASASSASPVVCGFPASAKLMRAVLKIDSNFIVETDCVFETDRVFGCLL